MSDFRFIGSIIFVFLFIVSVAFVASTDENVPMTQLELPVQPSDFDFASLMEDVPQIPQIQIIPTVDANETLITAGIPVVEHMERWFRTLVSGVEIAGRAIVAGGIFAINMVISVLWLIGNLLNLLWNLIRIDQWPVFQGNPILQQFSLILTAVVVIAVVVFFIYLFTKLIPTMGG